MSFSAAHAKAKKAADDKKVADDKKATEDQQAADSAAKANAAVAKANSAAVGGFHRELVKCAGGGAEDCLEGPSRWDTEEHCLYLQHGEEEKSKGHRAYFPDTLEITKGSHQEED